MAHCDILEYGFKVFMQNLAHLIGLGHVGVSVAWITGGTRLLLDLVEELWSLLLEKLAVAVVIFEGNTILIHDVVVGKLG
jgi:hypothetical protein